MCIIIYKDSGVEKPTLDILKECWSSNKDGAGILLIRASDPTRALVSKGYMEYDKFINYIDKLHITKDDVAVYHFRIGTSGGINPEKTHPFPISANVADLNRTGSYYTTKAFIHNGVFHSGSKELSDTQMYVKDELVHYINIEDDYTKKLVLENTTGTCRTVTIDLDKSFIYLTGNWEKDHGGLLFSNKTYKPTPVYTSPYVSSYKGRYWDYKIQDWVYPNGKKTTTTKDDVKKAYYGDLYDDWYEDDEPYIVNSTIYKEKEVVYENQNLGV